MIWLATARNSEWLAGEILILSEIVAHAAEFIRVQPPRTVYTLWRALALPEDLGQRHSQMCAVGEFTLVSSTPQDRWQWSGWKEMIRLERGKAPGSGKRSICKGQAFCGGKLSLEEVSFLILFRSPEWIVQMHLINRGKGLGR